MEIKKGSKVIRKSNGMSHTFLRWCEVNNINPKSVFNVIYVGNGHARLSNGVNKSTFMSDIEFLSLVVKKKDHFPAWW